MHLYEIKIIHIYTIYAIWDCPLVCDINLCTMHPFRPKFRFDRALTMSKLILIRLVQARNHSTLFITEIRFKIPMV